MKDLVHGVENEIQAFLCFRCSKIWKLRKNIVSLQREKVTAMGNSRTITIKNPSRKLEEKIREAGVKKYLWLKELCSEDTKPNKVIYV